eukprot:361114-Chlamydomonas_euryale.AAC.4
MPDESVVSSCCLLKGWWDWVASSAGHALRGGIELQRLCARFSRLVWRGGVDMAWLRTMRNGVPFVTALSSLLDPLFLAMLNTGIPGL